MAKLQPRKAPQNSKTEIDKSFLSVILGNKCMEEELTEKDEERVDLFEKGLGANIDRSDTVDNAIEKMVKTALACEFGPSFVIQKGAERMVKTISHGIVTDSELRKQALIIIDRFADQERPTIVPSTRKTN